MQEHHRPFGNLGNILQGSAKVEATRLGIVVAVLFDSETGSLEKRDVIAPRRIGHVHLLGSLEEVTQEEGSNGEGTSS